MSLLLRCPTTPAPAPNARSDAAKRWNLNVHYHRLVLDAVPTHARTAIDIGSGDGHLAADLVGRGLEVTALDRDRASVARTAGVAAGVEAIHGDLLCSPDPLADGSLAGRTFDVVASIAMLHHVDAVEGIRAMRRLVAPGGALVIVGFGQIERPAEVALAVAGQAVKTVQKLRGRLHDHHAPIVWPPTMTFEAIADLAAHELPGSHFRRLLSSRYAITWRAPSTAT